MNARYDAVVFDLLTALLDSWSLWNEAVGDVALGRRWRGEYLKLTYAIGGYRPYEDLVAEAARAQGIGKLPVKGLLSRWDELQPWPEAPSVLAEVAQNAKIGVVTNCSDELGQRAVQRTTVDFDVVITAQAAGAYKPRREPYLLALNQLSLPAERVLFVAGSPYDIAGAGGVGMPVWWHNRIHMERGNLPPPVAEHASLIPLPGHLQSVTAPR
jgi:2-haloacid dehalogenase